MRYLSVLPDARLVPFIRRYYIIEAECWEIDMQRLIPNGYNIITFSIYPSLAYRYPLRNDEAMQFIQNPIIGPIMEAVDVYVYGPVSLVNVEFEPTGFNTFFDIPLQLFSENLVSLAEFGDFCLVELYELLQGASSWESRIKLINAFFLKRLFKRGVEQDTLLRIKHTIQFAKGNIGDVNVHQLANYACLCDRQFLRVFTDVIGYTPRDFLFIEKLNQAKQFLFTEDAPLYKIADRCGYSDKSHMIKAFKKISGYTPQFLRKIHIDIYEPDVPSI